MKGLKKGEYHYELRIVRGGKQRTSWMSGKCDWQRVLDLLDLMNAPMSTEMYLKPEPQSAD